jgi:hypothetical protein
MGGSAVGSAKICVRCGEDCSNKARVKDKSGRYMCQPCLDAIGDTTGGTSGDTSKVVKMTSRQPAMAGVSSPESPLIEDASDVLGLSQSRPPSPAPTRAGAVEDEHYTLSPVVAGDDPTKRPSFKAIVGKPEKSTCKQCGYDCTGIPAGTPCPECASTVRKLKRDAKLQDVSEEVAREAILRPLYWIVGGLVTIAIGLTMWGKGWEVYAVAYISWLMMIPVGLVAFALARLIFLQYDEEWKAAALQLGATFAVVGGVNALLGGAGIGGGLVGGAAMIFMFMYVMDMEKIEAIGLAVLLFFVQIGLVLGLVALVALL